MIDAVLEQIEKTENQREMEERDENILKDWEDILRKNPEVSRTMLTQHLKDKYGFKSDSGIWFAKDRAKRKRAKAASKTE